MSISSTDTCATISEIADRIWRINTPIAIAGGTAFSFNQYLVKADRSLLFHTGPRHLFQVVRDGAELLGKLANALAS